jgi:hypothetical protein
MASHTVKFVRHAVSVGVTLGLLDIATQASGRPAWTECPLDGAQAILAKTEYHGKEAIGVYEHTTITGETHRFRMRGN